VYELPFFRLGDVIRKQADPLYERFIVSARMLLLPLSASVVPEVTFPLKTMLGWVLLEEG
jgi:hypothetical protein